MRKHISEDGQVRNCTAKTPETCTAKGPNGEKAEHFDNTEKARERSEEILSKQYKNSCSLSNLEIAESFSKDGFSFNNFDNDENVVIELENLNLDEVSRSFEVNLAGTKTKKDIINSIVNETENYDPDNQFAEGSYADGGIGSYNEIKNFMEKQKQLDYMAENLQENKNFSYDDYVKEEKELKEQEVKEIKDQVESLYKEYFPVRSAFANVNNIETFISDANLDYGNSEIFEQDEDYFVSVEAPNNAVIAFIVPKNAKMEDVYVSFNEAADDFSAEDEFDEIWSQDFGKHNNFYPIQFAKKLDEDELFFKETSNYFKKLS